jgi:hypothetical protein
MGLPYQSVQRAVAFLVRMKLLREVTGQRRNRMYVAPELLQILRGPAFV